jgi:hypothetical protein
MSDPLNVGDRVRVTDETGVVFLWDCPRLLKIVDAIDGSAEAESRVATVRDVALIGGRVVYMILCQQYEQLRSGWVMDSLVEKLP